MSDTVPTVKIVSEEHKDMGGYKVINKSDLKDGDVIFKEKTSAPAPATTNTEDEFAKMSVDEMRAYLTSKGVTSRANAAEDALRAKCREVSQP